MRSLSESFPTPPGHVSSRASQTLPQKITPSDPPLRISSRSASFDHINYKAPITSNDFGHFQDRLPQLSERDNIFLTHYLHSETSNATTPKEHPANYSSRINHGPQDVPSNLELSEPLPQASSPALLPRNSGPSASITSLHIKLNSQQLSSSLHTNPLHSRFGSALEEYPIHLYDNLQHQRLKGDKSAAKATSGTQSISTRPTKTNAPLLPRINTAPILSSLRMSDPQESSEPSRRDRPVTDEGGGTRSRRLSGERRRRSSSRDNVEKRIEATLANEEAVTNPRSRKASHYFGLFKENTSSQDPKKKDAHKDGSIKKSKAELERNAETLGRDAKVDARVKAIVEGESQVEDERLAMQRARTPSLRFLGKSSADDREATKTRLSRVLSGGKPTHPLSNTPDRSAIVTDVPLSDEPDDDQHAIEWRTRPIHGEGLPLRLLQEIRSFLKAKLPSKTVETVPQRTSFKEETQDQSRNAHNDNEDHETTPTASDNESPSGKDTSADDEFEPHEHISSATYFPHQALESSDPSLDGGEAQEQVTSIEKRPRRSTTLEILHEETHDSPDDEVQIALLQSQHKKQTFHGDLPPLPVESRVDEALATTYDPLASSTSESEYESYDELGQSGQSGQGEETEDGDVTPTAEKRPRHYSHRRRRRPAPLGAVELKPYKHQVGGHSTVFRFSKRAVCKQLTNRENVFYEVVERVHPELLRFLPK